MALTVVHRSSSATDLAALHDAFAGCIAAVLQAWHGDQEPVFLSLLEAEVDALNAMLAAIKQAARRGVSAPRRA